MSARESLCSLMEINSQNFSKEEILLLEAEILVRIHKELLEIFKKEHAEYFNFIKFTSEMEKDMLETNFISLIIKDILSTDYYTLEGIAYTTKIHEDILSDLASGINTQPSANSLLKLIELHISVRKDLYDVIRKKLTKEF